MFNRRHLNFQSGSRLGALPQFLSLSLSPRFQNFEIIPPSPNPRCCQTQQLFLTVPFSLPSPVSTLLSLLPLFLGFHRSTPSIPCNHMALPSSESKESYCRKQKSLGLLCTNFLSLYNQDGIETIGLDDAATRLGVERRRIYDIVNVLESVGVLARKAKNRYSWKGFGEVPKALEELREEGLRENGNDHTRVSDDDEDENNPTPITSSQEEKTNPSSHTRFSMASKTDNRKEKSLGLLTQNFIKLFLCTDVDLISLEEAAKILLGDARDLSTMRTKVRRLYDIANVLSSMNFIEKVHHPDTRKPAFRWLGMREKLEDGSANSFVPIESKKRTFGTEITNTSFKRTKVIDGNLNQITKPQIQMQVKREVLGNDFDKTNLEQDSRVFKELPVWSICSSQRVKSYCC